MHVNQIVQHAQAQEQYAQHAIQDIWLPQMEDALV